MCLWMLKQYLAHAVPCKSLFMIFMSNRSEFARVLQISSCFGLKNVPKISSRQRLYMFVYVTVDDAC